MLKLTATIALSSAELFSIISYFTRLNKAWGSPEA